MQEEHRRAIQINFGSLVEQTDLDVIVPVLYEKGVFSEAMIAPYRDMTKDVRMRKRELYRDIERRGPTAFGCLLEALTETGHWDLVRALDPESNLHPFRSNHSLMSHPMHTPNQDFVSLSKQKEVTKIEAIQPNKPTTSKTPFPPDFSNPGDSSAEIPRVRVVKSTKFHERTKEGIPLYPTRSRRRGVLIALSFFEFMNNIEEYRRGAVVDCTNLKYLFDEIGFRTVFYNNLTKEETKETLRGLRKNEYMTWSRHECVFVVVSSHGYERGNSSDTDIRCADGQLISILHIIEHFNNKNFPALHGVPKVFIFQSCRGSSQEYNYSKPRPISAPQSQIDGQARGGTAGAGAGAAGAGAGAGAGRSVRSAEALLSPDRLYSDILIAHSTLPGFVSRRDPEKGSWYIQVLCEVFAERAHDCHVEQLFTLVDTRLDEKFQTQTSSIDRWGFNKRLYLHPGLFED